MSDIERKRLQSELQSNTVIYFSRDEEEKRTLIRPRRWMNRQAGKVGWALLWLLGIPLPVLLVLYLIRGH